MANVEWAVEHELTSDYGSLFFNRVDGSTGRVYRIQPDGYKMIPSLRVTQDNLSQADGSVLHPRWTSGLTTVMTVALNVQINPDQGPDYEPACEQDLREMMDDLILHLNAIRHTHDDNQRLYWTPSGLGDQQLLQNIELLAIWDPTTDLGGLETLVTFAIESPFPYCINSTQHSTDLADGVPTTLTNMGNAAFSPVIKVDGGTANWTITNADDLDPDGVPFTVVYDASRPDAEPIPGSYGEIDFFQGTIYNNGSGADLIAGIDPATTDFWHLNPGDNEITISGATATILWNDAWA
jgi:hypothetical protein